MVWCEFVFMA